LPHHPILCPIWPVPIANGPKTQIKMERTAMGAGRSVFASYAEDKNIDAPIIAQEPGATPTTVQDY